MIDSVKDDSLSLEAVRAIVAKSFGDDVARVYQGDDGGVRFRFKLFRKGTPDDGIGEFASAFLRHIAGKCLAVADEIDVAAGRSPEVELEEVGDNRRYFLIPGFRDRVEIMVHDTRSSEDARRLALQAIASMTKPAGI